MKVFWITFCITFGLGVSYSLGAEEGMPQLNPEFWYAQIFWLVIIFLVLYISIWKVFLPKISNSIENRKSKIIKDLLSNIESTVKDEEIKEEAKELINNITEELSLFFKQTNEKISITYDSLSDKNESTFEEE